MNGIKRYVMQKGTTNRHGTKAKDIATSSRHEQSTTDTESFINNLPLIRQSENAKLLPRYSAILGRSDDDGVNMDDLDQLQLDFEKLISTCAVRNRYLRGEIESIDKVEERRDRKGKSYDKVANPTSQTRLFVLSISGIVEAEASRRQDEIP
jgi:transcriptional adapter 3